MVGTGRPHQALQSPHRGQGAARTARRRRAARDPPARPLAPPFWAGRPRERPTGRRGARPLRSASMSGAVAEAACPPVGLQSCSDRAAMPGSRFRAQKTSGVQSPAWTLQCGKHSSEPRLSGQFEADRALIRDAWCSKVPCGRCVGLNFPIVKPPVLLPSYAPCPLVRPARPDGPSHMGSLRNLRAPIRPVFTTPAVRTGSDPSWSRALLSRKNGYQRGGLTLYIPSSFHSA